MIKMQKLSHTMKQNMTMQLAPSNIQQRVHCTNSNSSLFSKKGHFATDSPLEMGSKLKSSYLNKVDLEETVVEMQLTSSLSNLGSTQAGISTKDSQDKKRRKEDDPQEKIDEKPNSKIHKEVRKVTKCNCK